MGKFDMIDWIFISLISFYLVVFTVIFVLLILKYRGIRGLFRYLLTQDDSLENISRIIAIYGFIAGTVILLSLFIS